MMDYEDDMWDTIAMQAKERAEDERVAAYKAQRDEATISNFDNRVGPHAATPAQLKFIASLLADRDAPGVAERVGAGITKRDASGVIDQLKAAPRRVVLPTAPATASAPLTAGVYETSDGQVYVVKPNKAGTHLYAKRMVVINGERLNENDEHVQIEFEYAPGAIRTIQSSDRMSVERAKELTLRYGRCINCGRRLKAAVSVERGIGPVCIKMFA